MRIITIIKDQEKKRDDGIGRSKKNKKRNGNI